MKLKLRLIARIWSLAIFIWSIVFTLLGNTQGAIHLTCIAIFLWLVSQEDDEE